jgi:3alpha(or 20beta)-hydroxysteroid dehydrogenase
VTSEADWARAVEAAQKLGGLHGLVNNAGIYQPAALMETDDALWQRHIQINQYGCFLGMKAVVPAMERSGGGSIVNISSVAGLKGSPGSFAYAATKWALRGMTKSAAIDLGGRKIRVNSVHPGPIDTDMIAFRTPEQREQRMKQVPMHRSRNAGGGCAAGGIPALRREQLHHRGGDRHRRRFIGLALQ